MRTGVEAQIRALQRQGASRVTRDDVQTPTDEASLRAALDEAIETLESQGAPQSVIDSMRKEFEAHIRAQSDGTTRNLERQRTSQTTMHDALAASEQKIYLGANPVIAVGITVLNAIVFFSVLALSHAFYFMIVGRFMKTNLSFSYWFALSVWGRMPWVIASIVTLVATLVMNPQIDMSAYNLLALSAWMELPNESHIMLGSFVKTLDLMVIWSIVILTIGFSSWTERSMSVSLAVVAVPYFVVYALLMLY